MQFLADALYVWLCGCALLALLFGAEWLLNLFILHDNVDDHAEKPNPL